MSGEEEAVFLQRFLEKGRYRNGTTSEYPAYPLPTWVQPDLIKKGQEFITLHFFSIYFAHFISLLFLLCYQPVRVILLQTGQSDTGFKALKRYFSTLLHIKAWYEGDLLNDTEPAAADIHRIRKVHSKIGSKVNVSVSGKKVTKINKAEPIPKQTTLLLKALREDLSQITNNNNNNNNDNCSCDLEVNVKVKVNEPRISQLDMSVTQFCFMGFISLYPRVFGIFEDADGLAGFIHLWALIGHLIGIEDEFNLGLKQNAFVRPLILKHVLIDNLQNCDKDTIDLWKSLVGGISKIIPFISLNAILLFVANNLLDLECEALPKVFNPYDTFCFKLMKLCFTRLISFQVCVSALNALLRLSIFLTSIRLFGRIHTPKIVKSQSTSSSCVKF